MRKIILGVGLTLDGYIARSDGSVDFLFMPKDYAEDSVRDREAIDTAIMGRKTLDAALNMGGGALPKAPFRMYVFSRTREAGERDGVTFINRTPVDFVRDLRQRPGKDVWLMGGAELAREFLRADLVDEIDLAVVPTLLGKGIPLFHGGFPERHFVLVENKAFSGGLLSLKYKRRRNEKQTKSRARRNQS
jgi:dihydrofolate reductase